MTQGEPRRRSLGERLKRFLSSPEQQEADARAESAKASGALPLNQCRPRQKVVLRGKVTTVTISPAAGVEAELDDGTGTVSLIWMGRRRLECVTPGKELLVTGRLSEEEGRMVIYNPEFEVLS